uniref:Uncharacterized protein n=1 Tax=Megaselia scalaris TaxID=36166 RepID=T1GQS2_MEGSC
MLDLRNSQRKSNSFKVRCKIYRHS